MRQIVIGMVLMLSCFWVAGGAEAAAGKNSTFGVRVGTSFDDDEDFDLYTLFGSFKLPWATGLGGGWTFEPAVDLGLGLLDGNGEVGGRVSTLVDLAVFSPSRSLSVSGGVGVGLLFEEEYGPVDFGGPLFFIFQGGINYWFTPSFSLGYQFLHESNGSLYETNPSLNMHQLELRVHF